MFRRPGCRIPFLLGLGFLSTAGMVSGQAVQGMVAEQISLAPVRGAVVVLFRVEGPERLEPVATTTTDIEGSFYVRAPGPGSYRVQAEMDGLSTPMSPALELRSGDPAGEFALLMPSPLLHLALACQVEAEEGTAAVVGIVRDLDSGVPLPDAVITATWQEGPIVRHDEVATDAAGRYRFCGLPAQAGAVRFQGRLLGRSSPLGSVEIEGPSVVLHDMEISVASQAERPRDVIRERILLEVAAKELGDLRGQILDQFSGNALFHAVVRIRDTPHQVLTDEEGRFLFQGLAPGTYTLEIRNLGYVVVSEAVEVPPGKDVFVGLRVAPRAVELEGLEVTTRSAAEEIARLTPFRRDIVYGEIMAQEEARGAQAYEVLRRASPGLRVTEVYRESGPPILCIQTNRRVQSLSGNECGNVQVVVDGIRIHDGPEFLRRTPASEIESIEFLSPVHAQIAYGIGGDTSNGVVVVYTRGKGPYASSLRNRRR
ncbi:MAG: carboxypeptidase regulatory-like domain-containing protein [Gemmatimonadota bacterium]|nr:carboxypeptidase regulatory-like domain-containing protein [Gemmatimonadota bacterium]